MAWWRDNERRNGRIENKGKSIPTRGLSAAPGQYVLTQYFTVANANCSFKGDSRLIGNIKSLPLSQGRFCD